MSDKTDVRNGVLQALPGITLRDFFAGCTVAGVSASEFCSIVDKDELATFAFDQADSTLAVRDSTQAEDDRRVLLAEIGELAIRDYLGTCDVNLIGEQLKRAIESYVAKAKAADTEPAPAPEPEYTETDSGSLDVVVGAAIAVPDGATPIFTSASGDEPVGYSTSTQVGTAGDGTPVMGLGPMVGKARGEKDEGGST